MSPTGAAANRAPRRPADSHLLGMVLALAGASCWSLAGLFVRLTDGIDTWQIVFYRSIVVLVIISAWIWSMHGRRSVTIVRQAGWTAVIAGIAVGLAGLSFLAALFHTTVAQAIFMMGIAPFCSALLGWWILRERVPGPTWFGMVIALLGLGIMLAGGPGGGSFVGSILALYFAFAFACYSVLLRWGQHTEMIAAQIWNALFLIAFSGAVLLLPTPLRDVNGLEALAIGWTNLGLVVLMGAVQLSLGMILFTRGARSVSATELSFLALAEPTLAPVWVWLAVGEVPTLATIVGGAVIILAIVIHIALSPARTHPAVHPAKEATHARQVR